jgi:hypothetical protein
MNDATGNIKQDVVNRFFSVAVVPKDGTPASDDTTHHSYFRMGMPDNAAEKILPNDPNHPERKGTSAASPWKDGLVLYTDGQYKVVAPSLSTTSKESLTINANEGSLASATYSTSAGDFGKYFFGPIQSTISHQNTATATLGLQVSGILGESHTIWTGLRNTSGAGTNLTTVGRSDIKATTSQTINIGLGSSFVQGGGSSRFTQKHDLFSTGDIRLSSSRLFAGTLMPQWEFWRKATIAFLALAAATPVALTFGGIGVWADAEDGAWGDAEHEDRLKADLIGSAIAWTPMIAMATVIQVGISISAGLSRTVAEPNAVAAGLANATLAELLLSDTNQTYLKKGLQQLTFDTSANNVILANGPVGGVTAFIQMSPAALTLRCGTGSITLDAGGVTINGATVTVASTAGATAGILTLAAAGASLGGTPIMLNAVNAAGFALAQAQQAAVAVAGAGAAAAQVVNQAAIVAQAAVHGVQAQATVVGNG